ncbi:hypothetical protein DFO66_10957 [Brevibacterium sanguinis]|uniref:Uncharacterized protein n=2 Tax=Brevibacterium TaxID=1696 RepID=A0A366IG19_9MICO|nr:MULTISPECIES: hypothetical protein [Brevibacterium]RBP63627.1 hypothetical protein DFO66_10957 [Brevibacterium sanguinis]RBP70286.1 hypothetical protein DFO65_10957 [Brevibacterium celere]
MTDPAPELATEVRRLRVRIIGLSPRHLDEPVASDPHGHDHGAPLTRRLAIAEALAGFSDLGSGGHRVPELGDGSLADQVVVLLEEGARTASTLPDAERDALLRALTERARQLRRQLA